MHRHRIKRYKSMVRVFALFALVSLGWHFIAAPVEAIQKESQAEKEANLKGQAQGGLFNRWTFDKEQPNGKPQGFSELSLGNDSVAAWIIQTDGEAPSAPNILKIDSSCQVSSCFQLLVADKLQYEYPDISVRLRFPSEGHAGYGGIVLGLQDAKNFYAVVIDLASKKLETIRVLDGQTTVLGEAGFTPKAVNWHSLRVQRDTIISKDVINAYFDGVHILSVRDQTLAWGQVGLVVRGKSSLLFDSLHAIPLFTQRPFSDPSPYAPSK